jgi:hypothetical protein
MIELLQQAIAEVSKLSYEEQDSIATWITSNFDVTAVALRDLA